MRAGLARGRGVPIYFRVCAGRRVCRGGPIAPLTTGPRAVQLSQARAVAVAGCVSRSHRTRLMLTVCRIRHNIMRHEHGTEAPGAEGGVAMDKAQRAALEAAG